MKVCLVCLHVNVMARSEVWSGTSDPSLTREKVHSYSIIASPVSHLGEYLLVKVPCKGNHNLS